jgi:two-component system chemotaxis response regulator CheB
MPESALHAVAVDHKAPVSKMAPLLEKLSAEQVIVNNKVAMKENEKTKTEINTALQEGDFKNKLMKLGELTPYTCPECNGVLLALKDGGRTRFRCYVGHAFSAESLLASITDKIEDNLWNTIRGLEENIFLLNHVGDHFAEANHTKLAAMYFQKAKEAEKRVQRVRQVMLNHEQLSSEKIKEEAEGS